MFTKPTFLNIEERNEPLTREEVIEMFDEAFQNQEFRVYLQPQHCIQEDDQILAAEALARWQGENGAIILPKYFVGMLEQCGIIYKLDRYIAEELCKFINKYRDEPWIEKMKFSVNASKDDLRQKDFVEFYIDLRERYEIPRGMIEIEFTESAFYGDFVRFRKVLQQLQDEEFSCAMDDFGTGTSSLTMLKELPIDILKMDKNFFDDTVEENKARNNSIIGSMVSMGRGLGMVVVAEGVEDEEQLEYLRKIGCDYVQGFVFSEPLPPEGFIKYIKDFKKKGKVVREIKPHIDKESKLSKPMLEKRYLEILKYASAVIIEVYPDIDQYKILSTDQYGLEANSRGCYSEGFKSFIESLVFEEDVQLVSEKGALKNLITAFYRGGEEENFEYRGKRYDLHKKDYINNYDWFAVKISFEEFEDGNRRILIYLKNIQEMKNMEKDTLRIQKQLEYVLNGIQGAIFEVDYKNNEMVMIKDYDDHYSSIKSGEFKTTFTKYIKEMVHPDDQKSLNNIFSRKTLMAYENNDNVSFSLEFQVKNKNGEGYRWKRMNCLGTIKENKNKAYVIVQDLKKDTVQKYVDVKSQFMHDALHIFYSVIEINMETGKCDIIKTDSYLRENTLDCPTYEDFHKKFRELNLVYPKDDEKVFELFAPKNLKAMFKQGKPLDIEYRMLNPETKNYEWHKAYTVNNDELKTTILFVVDIDDQKKKELSVSDQEMVDSSTQLLNVKGFYETCTDYIAYKGTNRIHSMICISLDNFELIKNKGKQYLEFTIQSFVQNIKKHFDNKDIIGRIGENEIAILFRKNTDENALSHMQIIANIIKKEVVGYLTCTFSAGIASFPIHTDNVKDLINYAHSAMLKAKQKGGDQCVVYDDSIPVIGNVAQLEKINTTNTLRQQDVLYNIFTILYKAKYVDNAFPIIFSYIGAKYDVSRILMMEIDSQGLYTATHEWCASGVEPVKDYLLAVPGVSMGITKRYEQYFIKTNSGITCNDINEVEESAREFIEPLGSKSFIQVPIVINGEIKGFIFVSDNKDVRVWTVDEVNIINKIARRMSVFISNARLATDLERQKEMITNILNNSPATTYVVDPNTYKLLYLSDYGKNRSPFAEEGMCCYRAFMGLNAPCEFCPIKDYYAQVERKRIKKIIYATPIDEWSETTVSEIEWFDGSTACIVSSYDISKIKNNGL